MKHNGFSIDTEANGLIFEADKLWVLCCEDLDTDEKLILKPFEDDSAKSKFLQWLDKYDSPKICFHNGLGYDIFILKFVFGLDFDTLPDTLEGRLVQFVDTFYLSMFLNPDREGHSIAYFGEQLGNNKIEFRKNLIQLGVLSPDVPDGVEFENYHPTMDEYCQVDTSIGKKVYLKLIKEWVEIYGGFDSFPDFYKVGQKTFFLMSCQELSGWKFDIKLANELVLKIEGMMEEIRAEVEPKLPPRELKKTEQMQYKMPSKPFKTNGEFSSSMFKWLEKHNATIDSDTNIISAYGLNFKLESNGIPPIKLPMEMANQDQMKDWFLSMGWKPEYWNYKRGDDGKPIRDAITRKPIPTTPKIQEAGKLCPNLEKMEGDIIRQVVKWLSLRNRLSVLQGWLSNPRLQYDGRIGAGRTGIAATHRQKHRTVVNVPKASAKVLLGYEFRSLWTSEDGFYIAAADAAALEGRVQGHFCFKYDGGATATDLLMGDVHSRTAKSVYAKELADFDITSPDFNKDDPKFKPYRDRSKNIYYACLPMNTRVLTMGGWKEFKDISVGDTLPTFNAEKGIVEMDTVLNKHFFNDKELYKFSNKYDSFECTEDHRWYGWRRTRRCNVPSGKVYGYFEANEINQEHNIVLTAPWVGATSSDLSDDDCSLLGWLASDGYWSWSKLGEGPSSSKGKKMGLNSNISQADSYFWKEIECLLGRMGASYTKSRIVKENGNHINLYKLKSEWLRPFLDRIFTVRKDKHDCDWTALVMKMSRSNLESFYNAFYLGDGYVTGKSEIISQNLGNIFEAVTTAAQLLGNGRVSFNKHTSAPSPMKAIRVQKRKHITCQELKKESLGVVDTFCLTTNNSSFIIWQDDFIGITGNCMYGAGDSKLATVAGVPEKRGKEISEKFWEANAATKELKDNLEKYWSTKGKSKYLPAIDGRMLCTRKKSALLNTIFQSCGGITMDYAGLFMNRWLGKLYFDDLRRPYYLYKGAIVRRIGYTHDELEYECEGEDIANEVAQMTVKAIVQAGKYLKLNIELAGEGKVGKNWKETH